MAAFVLQSFFEGQSDFNLYSDGSVSFGSWIKPTSGVQFFDNSQLTSASNIAFINASNIFSQANTFNNLIQFSDSSEINNSQLTDGSSFISVDWGNRLLKNTSLNT